MARIGRTRRSVGADGEPAPHARVAASIDPTLSSALTIATLLTLLTPFTASPAHGQNAITRGGVYDHPATYLGITGAMGAITAGVTAWRGGESVTRAVAGGAIGGALGHLGVRVAVQAPRELSGAGLLVAAAGGSMIHNAGHGFGLADRLILPLGPVYVELERGQGPRAYLSAVRAHRSACLLVDRGYRWDRGESLARLTPVFRRTRPGGIGAGWGPCRHVIGANAYAAALSGHIVYGAWQEDWWPFDQTMSHELGHVAQHAREEAMVALSLGQRVSRRVGAPGWLVLDVVHPWRIANLPLLFLAPTDERRRASFYEREVLFAEGVPVCTDAYPFRCYW